MRLQRLLLLLLVAAAAVAISVHALTFRLPTTCTTATLSFSNDSNATVTCNGNPAAVAPEDTQLSTQVFVYPAATTTRLDIAEAPQPTQWLRELLISRSYESSATPPPIVALSPTALTSHRSLSSLTMENVRIEPPNVVLRDVASLYYLKLVNTDASDVSLELSNDLSSKLTVVDLDGTKFTRLPRFLYERSYTQIAVEGLQLSESPVTPQLTANEYQNLQSNWKIIQTTTPNVSLPNVTFRGSCDSTDAPASPAAIVVCSKEQLRLSATVPFPTSASPERAAAQEASPKTEPPPGQAPPRSETETEAETATAPPATAAPDNHNSKYEPSASSSRSTSSSSSSSSSSSTTSWIIGIVASCAVAGALAFAVARRHMSAASQERSSFRDDAMVDLISKHDALAIDPEAAAVRMAPMATTTTTDLALAPFLVDAGTVSLGKALGSGRLSRGSYGQRKVVVQRVRAEASAGHATQALRAHAELLATVAHANIAAFVGVAWLDGGSDFAVLSESVHKGATLEALALDSDTALPVTQRLALCLDAARAVAYLHAHEPALCVRRLTSRKFVLTESASRECKLSLFECVAATATAVDATEMLGAGEIAWLAPELVRDETHDPRAANVFALGVLLSEVLTRTLPYQQESEQKGLVLADASVLQRLRTAVKGTRLEPHEQSEAFQSLPSTLQDVVVACLAVDPKERPTAAQVVAALERYQQEQQATETDDAAA